MKDRGIVAHLDDALDDLQMAELGAKADNRQAAFHLQQAAEKLTKAIRLMRELLSNKSHDLEELALGSPHGLKGLPEGDPWIDRLRPFFSLTIYATTFRYPTPGGKRKPGPARDEVLDTAKKLRGLVATARSELNEA